MQNACCDKQDKKLDDLLTHQGQLQSFLGKWGERQELIVQDLRLEFRASRGSDEYELDRVSELVSPKEDSKPRIQSHVSITAADSIHTKIVERAPTEATSTGQEEETSFASVHSLYEQLKAYRGAFSNRSSHPSRPEKNTSVPSRNSGTSCSRAYGSRSSFGFLPRPPTHDEGGRFCTKCKPLFRSGAFETFNCLVIFINVIVLAMAADASINQGEYLSFGDTAEWFFCGYYILELMLRMYGHGPRRYFCTRGNWAWNLLDWTLIAALISERLFTLFKLQEASNNGQSLVSFRSIRLIKCVQCFRFIKIVRTFRELRMIASTISGSFKPLIWSFALMLVITFMFGTCLLQAAASFLEDNDNGASHTDLKKHWGSLSRAMLSLYAGVTGGEDWMNLAEPLKDVGAVFYGLFVVYIVFYFCVIVNTLTSLFVASTLADADRDEMQIMLGELERKDRYVKTFSKWFAKLDKDFSGDVSLQEFKTFMTEPDFVSFAARLGIDVFDMRQFFTLLSSGGVERVDIERFVVWCIKLRGNAKSIDLLDLTYWHKESVAQMKRVAKACQNDFNYISMQLKSLQDGLNVEEERGLCKTHTGNTPSAMDISEVHLKHSSDPSRKAISSLDCFSL